MTEPVGTTSDDRLWAMLAHLGAAAGLILGAGYLGWLVPLILYFVKRDQSRFVAFHALQELFWQIAWMVIITVGWAVTGILFVVLIGFLLIPIMIALGLVPLIWSIVAALKANAGEWYEYPVVGEWARRNVAV